MKLPAILPAAAILAALPATAHAALPDPVRAMIEAAIATGDADKAKAVIEIARQTNPDETQEIDALEAGFKAQLARAAAEEAARKEKALRSAGLFDNWSGKGELGASRSTGNSRETGVTAGLALERKGIDWRHKLRAHVDYQRSDGVTTKEQFLAAYEPNYTITDGLFAYGLAQYERDRFQGYASRVSVSGGLGYRVIETDALHLSIKGGPAWRRTWFTGDGHDDRIAALAALDAHWDFAKGLSLTQEASAFLQSDNSTFTSTTGLQARINGNLSTRFSYTVEHDTDPPAGAVSTDTLSRFTLIYDF